MKSSRIRAALAIGGLSLVVLSANYAWAHCDGLDGPVVKAAQRALQTNNVNLILIWVGKTSEPELRATFAQTLEVRKLSPETRALADRHLFETLVRLHRTGEGAAYTGLKPAGRDLGPAIPAADRSLETESTDALEALLVKTLRTEIRQSFARVQIKANYDPNDVPAGREYVKAYIEYIHFVERLHEDITHSAEGHYAEVAER